MQRAFAQTTDGTQTGGGNRFEGDQRDHQLNQ